MSDPQITPELLRAIADEAKRIDKYIDMGAVLGLHRWAANLEREQSDEKRVATLGNVYWAAQRKAQNLPHDYDKLPGSLLAAHRAGIRAVLAKLDEEREDAAPSELRPPFGDPVPRTWDTLKDVPGDVRIVCHTVGRYIAARDGIAAPWVDEFGYCRSIVTVGPFEEVFGGDS